MPIVINVSDSDFTSILAALEEKAKALKRAGEHYEKVREQIMSRTKAEPTPERVFSMRDEAILANLISFIHDNYAVDVPSGDVDKLKRILAGEAYAGDIRVTD